MLSGSLFCTPVAPLFLHGLGIRLPLGKERWFSECRWSFLEMKYNRRRRLEIFGQKRRLSRPKWKEATGVVRSLVVALPSLTRVAYIMRNDVTFVGSARLKVAAIIPSAKPKWEISQASSAGRHKHKSNCHPTKMARTPPPSFQEGPHTADTKQDTNILWA